MHRGDAGPRPVALRCCRRVFPPSSSAVDGAEQGRESWQGGTQTGGRQAGRAEYKTRCPTAQVSSPCLLLPNSCRRHPTSQAGEGGPTCPVTMSPGGVSATRQLVSVSPYPSITAGGKQRGGAACWATPCNRCTEPQWAAGQQHGACSSQPPGQAQQRPSRGQQLGSPRTRLAHPPVAPKAMRMKSKTSGEMGEAPLLSRRTSPAGRAEGVAAGVGLGPPVHLCLLHPQTDGLHGGQTKGRQQGKGSALVWKQERTRACCQHVEDK